jgi:HEAT repeat protein
MTRAALLAVFFVMTSLPALAAESPEAETDWVALAKGLDAPRAKDRLAAVQAAGALGLERAAAYLRPILDEDKDREVRLEAVAALGRVPGEEAVAVLGDGLADGELKVRRAAVDALRRRPEASSVPLLARALSDRKPVIREAAALALGTKLTADQADLLLPALADADASVRESAIYALGTTGGETAVVALAKVVAGDEKKKTRALAADVLGMMGSRTALPELVAALPGADDLVLRPSLNNALMRIMGRTENRVREETRAKKDAPRPVEAVRPREATVAVVPPAAAPAVAVSTEAVRAAPAVKAKAVATEFHFKSEQAKEVFLVGAFLRGNRSALDPGADGDWSLTVYLKPGDYRYRFLVDGKKMPDPAGRRTEDGWTVITVEAVPPVPKT